MTLVLHSAPSTCALVFELPLFNCIYHQPQGPAFKPQPQQQSASPLPPTLTSSTSTSSPTITTNFNRHTNHSTASS
ncbi:hypothetical protein PGTUg99_026730 [Puccinia graminis f. sp. tritici]|uniref:Uncharacterized protein n=1 Tax=Puccinia graminis f. sp. tritici TaxID=56615 RepID=A0A5B0SEA7_PUCGR|nr:hypothetical protein PGTUg99_026730 [Puccinia graminis f. sp. tritici]